MEIMEIVDKMCDKDSKDYKYLNNTDSARKLMNIVNVPQNAEIIKILFDLGKQVRIYFNIPNDSHCYGLYAGHLEDGTENIELCIVGKKRNGKVYFNKRKNLCLDYFKNKK